MIIDSSALVAILRGEPESEHFNAMIFAAKVRRISAVSYVESGVVLDNGYAPAAGAEIDPYLRATGIKIEPVTETQAFIARRAYLEYGKGNHAARLNFGDCFAYALSKATGEPLLFKGEDFRKTDVRAAV